MDATEERPTGVERRPGAVGGLAAGSVAGLAAGLLGIGGGLLLVPILAVGLGVPLKRAVGTSLLGVLVTATVAVATEQLTYPDNVRWSAALLLAVGAVAGSWIGSRIVAATPTPRLARLMAIVLLVGALRMSGLLGVLSAATPAGAASGAALPAAVFAPAHLLAGLGAGIVSATFGVGGGILAVPLLHLMHPDWAFQACRATSLAMIVPTSLAGALLHRKLKNVDASLAALLVPGAAAGSVAGVLLANRLPGRPLEIAFAALLVIAAVRLWRR